MWTRWESNPQPSISTLLSSERHFQGRGRGGSYSVPNCFGFWWAWVELNLKQRRYSYLLYRGFQQFHNAVNLILKRGTSFPGRPRYRYELTYPYICRGGWTRTNNLRFWRPAFYQLNYTPVAAPFPIFERCQCHQGSNISPLCPEPREKTRVGRSGVEPLSSDFQSAA